MKHTRPDSLVTFVRTLLSIIAFKHTPSKAGKAKMCNKTEPAASETIFYVYIESKALQLSSI